MHPVSFKRINRCTFNLCLVFIISACGGGGSSDPSPTPNPTPTPVAVTQTGIFVDGVVSGLDYKTATYSGTTNLSGEYDYVVGETVTFSVGGIVLGTATAGPVVTPVSLIDGATDATHPAVIKIVRFLLSLDEDGDPTNGININDATRIAAAGKSLDFSSADFESQAQAILDVVNVGATLVDSTVAQNHLTESLHTLWGTSVWGSDCWGAACS